VILLFSPTGRGERREGRKEKGGKRRHRIGLMLRKKGEKETPRLVSLGGGEKEKPRVLHSYLFFRGGEEEEEKRRALL